MDISGLEIQSNHVNECNICYETPCVETDLIQLICCNNSKNICINCIECLTTPICPYCRKEIDKKCLKYLNKQHYVAQSEPINITINQYFYSWEDFLREEHIINPYHYDDSRRLRRHIRNLRYEYRQRVNERTNQETRQQQRRHIYHTNNRRRLNEYSNQMRDLYNNNQLSLQDSDYMFHMDD